MSYFTKKAKKLLKYGNDCFDTLMIKHLKKGELRKIANSRRQEILKQTILSEDQKRKINELFVNNYGEKIPFCWHQYFTAYTGNFDEKYIPELLFVPEFEHYINLKTAYVEVFADKNVIPLIAKANDIKTPKTLLSCAYGIFRNGANEAISKKEVISIFSNCGNAFIKPSVDSCSGHGCLIVNMKSGIDSISGKKADLIIEELENNFVVQEVIKCHKSITDVYPKSVNTFRVITYRWNGKIEVMPIIMRIGKGNAVVDNAHAGGIFIAVDNDGSMHKTAFTEFRDMYERHPDTQLVFEGHKIVGMEKVIDAAKRMHASIPQVGVYNWDFTINEKEEPVLIEANTSEGAIWVIQMAHGKGVFGDKTEDVLKWIRKMKSLKLSERENEKG